MLFGSLGVVAAIALVVIIAIIIAAKYRTVVPTNMVHIVNSSSGRRVYGKDSAELITSDFDEAKRFYEVA